MYVLPEPGARSLDSGHHLALALRTAYLSMHRQADAILSPFGLTANQFVLLSLLEQQDGFTQQELCRRASSDPNTIRPMLMALEKNGYVRREPHPRDGRAWLVRLTPRGHQSYLTAKNGSEPFRERLESCLSKQESTRLLELLERVASCMSTHSAVVR